MVGATPHGARPRTEGFLMTSSDHSSSEADITKVADLIRGNRFAMLTTTSTDGTMISRPMALQETDFDGDLWFFTRHDSRKISDLAAHPQVNVTVSSGSTWVSLTGNGVEVDDLDRKRELWNAGVSAWFPDGPEDPQVRLLKVDATSAEFWDTPGGRLASLVSFAKARLTGERYDGGENDTVDMR